MKIGFILNPIAGMGGTVALKGTDGTYILEKALEKGAKPVSPQRALSALLRLAHLKEQFEIITPEGCMGEAVLKKTGLHFNLLNDFEPAVKTSSHDTQTAVQRLKNLKIDLLIFAGGDGTAGDICKVFDSDIPVIGIPSGVKMHSAVFGINPERTGDLIGAFIQKQAMEIKNVEIMDMDEPLLRKGLVSTTLSGYLKAPFKLSYTQNSKSGSSPSDKTCQDAIARQIFLNIKKGMPYLIGPGTTLNQLKELIGFKGTLLGFDLVINKMLVKKDLMEKDIFDIVKTQETCLVLTPVGGQGYVLGRGNQQISPRVLHHIKKENLIIGATCRKLASFEGRPLLVDTGCQKTNGQLKGYIKVITGMDETMVIKIDA
ncbi:MAG: ATP-NAD kinase family protein [Proteobacteria bacterium]|nr:ATP-NAD kinase family protein [Pseudomonadota bacterium]MBU1585057.1 ATP-NAD kinase family protein [Pseudomonadota bacterium]MBU2456015.1 ATP-NAD kinase family protein [Pseudomonadota bacterium]MBU2627355.1 ATP-NAD kinase family protein [Pseudomonadota bacterium]